MMEENSARDVVAEALRSLPVLEPDRRRAENVRARCQAVLAHDRAAAARTGAWRLKRWPRALEPVVAAAASALFLADVLRRALALYGF